MIDARETVKQVSVRWNLPQVGEMGPHCREGTGFWWKCGHFLQEQKRKTSKCWQRRISAWDSKEANFNLILFLNKNLYSAHTPDPVLSNLQIWLILFAEKILRERYGYNFIPILQMRTLRPREGKCLPQGHTAGKRQVFLELGSWAAESGLKPYPIIPLPVWPLFLTKEDVRSAVGDSGSVGALGGSRTVENHQPQSWRGKLSRKTGGLGIWGLRFVFCEIEEAGCGSSPCLVAGHGIWTSSRVGRGPFPRPQTICKSSRHSGIWRHLAHWSFQPAHLVPLELNVPRLRAREGPGRVFTGWGPKETSSTPGAGAHWLGVGSCGDGGNGGNEGTQGPEFGSFALNPQDWIGVGVGGQWGQERGWGCGRSPPTVLATKTGPGLWSQPDGSLNVSAASYIQVSRCNLRLCGGLNNVPQCQLLCWSCKRVTSGGKGLHRCDQVKDLEMERGT